MSEPQHYQIPPTLAWEEFPDEIVAIDLDRGIYYNLTDGAADAFPAFATPATAAGVAAHLAPRYDAEPAAIEAAVASLLEELVAEGLVAAVPGGGEAPAPVAAPAEKRPLAGFSLKKHDDLQELLVIDPVHGAGDGGWPNKKG